MLTNQTPTRVPHGRGHSRVCEAHRGRVPAGVTLPFPRAPPAGVVAAALASLDSSGRVCQEQYFTEFTELWLSVTVTCITRVHAVCINKKFNTVFWRLIAAMKGGAVARLFSLRCRVPSVEGGMANPFCCQRTVCRCCPSRALLYSRGGLYPGTQSTHARVRASLRGIGRAHGALTSVTSVCFLELGEPQWMHSHV